jgi:Protein of unknown function (DUF4031)
MTVYVDDAHIPATVRTGRAAHTSTWCHLFADTHNELHAFAARLGLRRCYFQPGPARGDGSPSPYWHYDLTAGKRQQALRLGARPVTWRESIQIIADRQAAAERAKLADQPSYAAGLAFHAGDFARASRLLALARRADPARASLWAERAGRVHAAARARAAQVAGPGDPRPLDQIIQARCDAAGVGAADPAVQFIGAWNTQRLTAAHQAPSEPGPGGESEPRDAAADTGGVQREAGS